MKFGYYADNEIPPQKIEGYKVNSHGYRCAEFSPLPDGGKNVVVLGCSHTFGIGLLDDETWISKLESLLNNSTLRFWNLGSPGASCDRLIRLLYSCERVLYPKIIIACWPAFSRRERLEDEPRNLVGDDRLLATETEITDRNNFLKCVFQAEKFSERAKAKIFHCFAEEPYSLSNTFCLDEVSLKNCWPEWDHFHLPEAKRTVIREHSVARDGFHYGTEHHDVFAQRFYNKFKSKFR